MRKIPKKVFSGMTSSPAVIIVVIYYNCGPCWGRLEPETNLNKGRTMYKGIKTILFPTDLTPNCIPAFDFATLLSVQFQAKIVLLHVKERIPDYIEGRLEGLLGEDQWGDLRNNYENSIRQKLIGKQSSGRLIQMALEHLYNRSVPGDGVAAPVREVLVADGDTPVSEAITQTAKEHDCDVIVMGSNQGLLSKQSLGSTVKAVMKHSAIPVVMVPYSHKIETE